MSAIDDEELARYSALLDALLPLAPAGREAWLSEQALDAATRDRLAGMLAAAERTGALDDARDQVAPPARIGDFRLVELLGTGGMGSVYRAERERAGATQRVALKLMRLGVYERDQQAAFLREQRILARLEHPKIARLIDAGFTTAGVPWFAMELVDGVALDRYARERAPPLASALRLVVEICGAVAYAHRNLVVHRDLKPSNILVNEAGEIRLLDFGIAKLLDEPGEATRTEQRMLTPAYAAPEQIAGGVITTAVDVHALGVILHELVTRQRPKHLADGTLVLPSELASARALRGDIDSILARALQPDPARRYANAQELCDDLERHLEGRPVTARPETWAYRTSRLFRRHRVVVGATATILVALSAATVFSLEQARLAREQSRQANRAKNFMVELINDLGPQSPKGGAQLTAVDLLDSAVSKADTELRDVPVARAELIATTALTLSDYGQAERGRTIVDAALASLDGAAPPLARAYLLSAQANFAETAGDLDSAERASREAIRLFEAAGDTNTSTVLSAIYPRSVLASIVQRRGDTKGAFELRRKNVEEAKARGLDAVSVAYSLRTLALSYSNLGSDAEAERTILEAIATAKTRLAPDHHVVRELRANLARVWRRQGRYVEAERELRDWADYLAANPHEPKLVGASERALGEVYLKLGRPDDADRAFDAAQAAFGDASPDLRYLLELGRAHAALLRDDLSGTRGHFERARDYALAAFGGDHPNLAVAEAGMGYAQARSGDTAGDALLADAIARIAAHLTTGLDKQNLAEALAWQSELRTRDGHRPEALDLAKRSQALLAEALGAEHPEVKAAAARVAAATAGH